jgi:hypothetical protein
MWLMCLLYFIYPQFNTHIYYRLMHYPTLALHSSVGHLLLGLAGYTKMVVLCSGILGFHPCCLEVQRQATLSPSLSDDLLAKTTLQVVQLLKNRGAKSKITRTNIQMIGSLRYLFISNLWRQATISNCKEYVI